MTRTDAAGEVAALADLSRENLIARWAALHGNAPPRAITRDRARQEAPGDLRINVEEGAADEGGGAKSLLTPEGCESMMLTTS